MGILHGAFNNEMENFLNSDLY